VHNTSVVCSLSLYCPIDMPLGMEPKRGEVCPCYSVLHLDPDPQYTFSADFPLRFVIFSCVQ